MKIFAKKLFILFLLISFAIFGYLVFNFKKAEPVKAGAGDNVSGWVWSENIGWLSFNNTSGGGGTDYGLDIDSSTGVFSGYAWSENIGWLKFDPEGSYPASPNYSACLDLSETGQVCDSDNNYKISGWARACSVFLSLPFRKKITIDNTNVGDYDLIDFPLHVKIWNDPDIGAHARPDGYDIRFFQSDGITPLEYEREYFGVSNGLAVGYFWVKIPVIDHDSSTDIYISYGNPDVSDGQNPAGVWKNEYKGVYHLTEDAVLPGEFGEAIDSTENNHNGIYSDMWGNNPNPNNAWPNPGLPVDGLGIGIDQFKSADEIINLGNNTFNTEFSGAPAISFSLWASPHSIRPNEWDNALLSLKIYINGKTGLWVNMDATNLTNPNVLLVGGRSMPSDELQIAKGHTDISTNIPEAYHHLSGVLDFANNNITVYVDGSQDGWQGNLGFGSSVYTGGDNVGDNDPVGDNDTIGSYQSSFDGRIDEVRIYKGRLSPGWIKFEYYNTRGSSNQELIWNNEEPSNHICSGPLWNNNQRGGWDGWLKLRGADYGVSLNFNSDTNLYEFGGWAWGNDVIGWISFNCYGQDVCGKSDYKGEINLNFSPTKPDSLSETWDYCGGGAPQVALGVKLILNWDYTDPEGDSQAGYEILISNYSGFSDPLFKHEVNSSSQSYTVNLDDDDDWLKNLDWSDTYFWKVKVKDINGNWSDFSTPHSFTTPSHAYPYPDFTYAPPSPFPNDVVQFTNISKCYDPGGEIPCQPNSFITYEWNFNYPTGPINTTTWNLVEYIYSSEGKGTYAVRFKITDTSTGFGPQWCSRLQYIPVGMVLPIPGWKEITP